MPQFFLEGWFQATPGDGRIMLVLPEGSTDAEFDLRPRQDLDGVQIDGLIERESYMGLNPETGRFEQFHTEQRFAVLSWSNPGYRTVDVDYSIAPYTQLPAAAD